LPPFIGSTSNSLNGTVNLAGLTALAPTRWSE
jgi:hypothetical protein